MTQIIDFAAARVDREKTIIAVAGLIDANPLRADIPGVREFAFETRCNNTTTPELFYRDALAHLRADHAAALAWALDCLRPIDGWRGAIFGRAA